MSFDLLLHSACPAEANLSELIWNDIIVYSTIYRDERHDGEHMPYHVCVIDRHQWRTMQHHELRFPG